jgi:hypothetical protein
VPDSTRLSVLRLVRQEWIVEFRRPVHTPFERNVRLIPLMEFTPYSGNPAMQKKFLTAAEALELMGIAEDRLEELVTSGELKPLADRGTFKYRRSDLEDLIRAGTLEGTIPATDPDLTLVDQYTVAGSATPPVMDFIELDEDALASAAATSDAGQLDLGDELDSGPSSSDVQFVVDPAASSSDVAVVPDVVESSSEVQVVADASSSEVQVVPDAAASSSEVAVFEPSASEGPVSATSFFATLAEANAGNEPVTADDFAVMEPHSAAAEEWQISSNDSVFDEAVVVEGPQDSGLTLDTGDSGISLEMDAVETPAADVDLAGPDSGLTLEIEAVDPTGAATDDAGLATDEDSGISLETGDSGISLVTADADSGISLDAGDSGISLDAGDSGISIDTGDSGISLSTAGAAPRGPKSEDLEKTVAEQSFFDVGDTADATVPEPVQYFDDSSSEVSAFQLSDDDMAAPALRSDQTLELPTADSEFDVQQLQDDAPPTLGDDSNMDFSQADLGGDPDTAEVVAGSEVFEAEELEEAVDEEVLDASDESFAEYTDEAASEDDADSFATSIPSQVSSEPSWGLGVGLMMMVASLAVGANGWLMWEGLSTMWTGGPASGAAQSLLESIAGLY